jgi:OAH/OAS sulfhydrylase
MATNETLATPSSEAAKHFDTLQIHAGAAPDPTTHSRALPIYQTAAYSFEDAQDGADLFALKKFGNIYGRLTNSTVEAIEHRLVAIESASYAVAVASGHAAEILALLNIVQTGDSIVASNSLYGGTWNIFLHTFKRLGINVRFVETTDIDGFVAASDETTKAWYVETIGNPRLDVADVDALSAAALSIGLPLFVDNTFATPYLFRPAEHGAAVTIESLTKWIGGHGTSLGGAIIDSGTFNWGNGKFPTIDGPDDSYTGLNFWETFGNFPGLGNVAFGLRARAQLLRDFGPTLSPFNAQQIGLGLETLSLRVQRHSDNALAVAHFLENHPNVAWVSYPGLEGHPTHDVAVREFEHGFGGVVIFGVKGGREKGIETIDKLKLFSNLANVGDAKSLVIHPASTTHSQLSDTELVAAGISADLIRLSVGIEDIDDIIADLDQALQQA